MPQERAANNTAFVFTNYSNTRAVLECEIRSSADDSPSSANAVWVILKDEPIVKKIKIRDTNPVPKTVSLTKPVLKVNFPSLRELLDISVLYQALGFNSVNEVADCVLTKTTVEDPNTVPTVFNDIQIALSDILQHSFRNWKNRSPEDAKKLMGKFLLCLKHFSVNSLFLFNLLYFNFILFLFRE